MYDRGGLTFLPNHNVAVATGAPASFVLDQAAGTECSLAYTALTHGRIHSLFYSVTVVTAYTTLPAILAIHVNDVEVGTVTIPTGSAAGLERHVAVTPAAGKVLDFKPGDVLKIEVKQQPTGGTVTGGISPTLVVTLDQV